jgi:hypothetical protein
MNSSPPNPPRFLPTLTEIVQPSELQPHVMAAPPVLEDVMQSLQQQVNRFIEQRVREELAAIVGALAAEQSQALQLSIRDELQPLVWQAAAQVMNDLKSHPEMK